MPALSFPILSHFFSHLSIILSMLLVFQSHEKFRLLFLLLLLTQSYFFFSRIDIISYHHTPLICPISQSRSRNTYKTIALFTWPAQLRIILIILRLFYYFYQAPFHVIFPFDYKILLMLNHTLSACGISSHARTSRSPFGRDALKSFTYFLPVT